MKLITLASQRLVLYGQHFVTFIELYNSPNTRLCEILILCLYMPRDTINTVGRPFRQWISNGYFFVEYNNIGMLLIGYWGVVLRYGMVEEPLSARRNVLRRA